MAAAENERTNFNRILITCQKQFFFFSNSLCARKMHLFLSCSTNHWKLDTKSKCPIHQCAVHTTRVLRELETRPLWFKLIWFRINFGFFLCFISFPKNLLFRIQHLMPWRRANRYYALELQLRMSQVTYYNSTRHTTEKMFMHVSLWIHRRCRRCHCHQCTT